MYKWRRRSNIADQPADSVIVSEVAVAECATMMTLFRDTTLASRNIVTLTVGA